MIRMFRSYIAAAFCLLLLSILLASVTFAQSGAEATFKAKCAMCHGADASGNTVMGKKLNIKDLRAPEVQKKTDGELKTVITKGQNKMPAFEGKLSAAEIAQLATYVHQLNK